jgi:hypothetical protein
MKKITLLIALFLVAFQSEAQVLISQSFDTALTWTPSSTTAWSRRTVGTAPSCSPSAGAGMAKFASYDLASGTQARLSSPVIAFAGGNYRVKFNMYRDSGYPTDSDNLKFYYNTTATVGGTLLGNINRSSTQAPVVTTDGWYTYYLDIPGTPTGNAYIVINGTSFYGNNIYLDEVSVQQIQANDAQMDVLNLTAIIPNTAIGNNTVSGTVRNLGLTTINSMDINWQVDSGAIYTQSVTGLTVAANQTYNYTHPNQWNATPGLYSFKVWVSNINGGSVDGDATNDQIIRSISVASNATTRFPLYEKFSSATCAPCATFNGTYFNGFRAAHENDLALICYQVNWPGSGDPYYTAEVGSRVGYYGVSGAPTLFVDSKDGTNFNSALLESDLTAAQAKPAYFVLNATKNLVGNVMTVNVDILPYLSGSYKVQVAVVEKLTTGNIASNGETEFHNVMMKMMPNASGTTMNFTHDVPASITGLQATLTGLFIEELTDLDVVVFIQSTSNRSVMQATYATEQLATTQFSSDSKIRVYPNPTNGILRFATTTPLNVVISDISGKVVQTINQVTNESQVNLSSLQKGIYFAKLVGEGIDQTQKIILE